MSMRVPQPIFARDFGQGPRKVLALHCTIAHSGAWRGLAAQMDDEVTLKATDMLCHGRSPDWDGQGDFQDRMTEAALAHLTEPMDVIGHSFGASVALRLAVARPDLVRTLTMIESVHFAFVKDAYPDVMRRQTEDSRPFREAAAAGDYALAARIFNRGWGSDSSPPWDEMPEAMREAMTRGVRIVPACGPSITGDRPGLTKPGALDMVTMPVLLLRGDQTEEIIAAVNDTFERILLDAENVVVPGAGHMLPVTHPKETAEALRRLFLRVPV